MSNTANIEIQVDDQQLSALTSTLSSLGESLGSAKGNSDELGESIQNTSEEGDQLSSSMGRVKTGLAAMAGASFAAAGAVAAVGSGP